MRLEKWLTDAFNTNRAAFWSFLESNDVPQDLSIGSVSIASWVSSPSEWIRLMDLTRPPTEATNELCKEASLKKIWEEPKAYVQQFEKFKSVGAQEEFSSQLAQRLVLLDSKSNAHWVEEIAQLNDKAGAELGYGLANALAQMALHLTEGIGIAHSLKPSWIMDCPEVAYSVCKKRIEKPDQATPKEKAECWGHLMGRIIESKANGGRPFYWMEDGLEEALGGEGFGEHDKARAWAVAGFFNEVESNSYLKNLMQAHFKNFEKRMEPLILAGQMNEPSQPGRKVLKA